MHSDERLNAPLCGEEVTTKMHDAITLIRWVVTGICDIHGTGSPECTAAREVETLATTTVIGAALGGAVDGKDGAVPGGVLGFLTGLVINDRSISDRKPT